MARRFAGSTSTDRINFGNVATVTARTYSCWFYIDALDTTPRRFWDWATGASFESVLQTTTTVNLNFGVGWSTADGTWRTDAAPPTGAWTNLVITYDGSATTNDASFYYNGSIQASTQQGADPSGTLDSGNFGFNFGNRAGGDRSFDGALAELAQWNRILTAGEISSLGAGFSPLFYPNGLRFYVPLIGRNSPETDIKGLISGSLTGTANDAHPRIIYPSPAQVRRFTTAVVGAPDASTGFMTTNTSFWGT